MLNEFGLKMSYPVIYERIEDNDFPSGYYYAHLPTLGLTTHGEGIEGAKVAALDLLKLWIADENILTGSKEYIYSTLEV